MIAKAERPLILTASAGRDPAAFHALAQFTDRFAIPLAQFHPRYLSLPSSHSMNLRYDPSSLVADADLILAMEIDVPWIPDHFAPSENVQSHPMRVRPVVCAHSHPRVCLRSRHHRLDSHDPPGTDALGGTRSRSALCISATRRSMERHLLDRRLLRPREMRRGDIVVPQEGLEPPLPCEN
jgi:hypothetical protein